MEWAETGQEEKEVLAVSKEFGIKSIDPDLSKHAHLLFRFGDKEEIGLPFEFQDQTPWGPSLTREDISNNIRSLQRYLGERNMVY